MQNRELFDNMANEPIDLQTLYDTIIDLADMSMAVKNLCEHLRESVTIEERGKVCLVTLGVDNMRQKINFLIPAEL